MFQSPLDILEIGPGYGAATLNFVRMGNVKSYTLVDLPENLINSYYYLRENFGGWNFNLVSLNNPASNAPNTFNFISADRFSSIESSFSFDLAVNSDSFGEMPGEVAVGYIDKILTLLKSDGVLVSMNGHRRGQYEITGLERVSDYGYSNFKILNFSYKSHFSSSYDDFGHCAICMVSGTSKQKIDANKYLDIFGDLFALGINKDIDLILSNFNDLSMSKGNLEQMQIWESVLLGKDVKSNDIVTRYIGYMRKALVDNTYSKSEEEFLFNALESPQAKYYVKLVKYITGRWVDDDIEDLKATPALGFLACDLIKYSEKNFVVKKVHVLIRKAHLAKKIFPRRPLRVPMILKIRQVFEKSRKRFL